MNRIKLALIYLFLSLLTFINAQDSFEAKLLNKFHSITSEEMMSWVEKLCSPEFNGRLTGTPEFVASAEWIAGLKTTNDDIAAGIRKTFKPASFNTGKIVTIKANTTRHNDGKGCNVIGLIEGTDPVLKNEVIIIGGHSDAVGKAGKVVNGALDNASGVVDIMGAAQAMAQSGIQLKRSVMFLFIGGEETGLIGSKLYASHPVFPVEKTITYINLDMVGNGTGLAVSASTPYKQLLKYFEDANTKYIHRPFTGSASAPDSLYGRPRTDSYNFSTAGIRTMSIGTTGGYKKVFYHLPGDDPDAITIEIMEDVAKMIYVALTDMANDTSLNFQ
jgi:Zn-dependent M28 family amino/carboxypeptidase